MKKLLIYVLCIFNIAAIAQITFPAVGATWHYNIYNQNQTLKYTHDSLFMGKTTKVIENPYCFFTCGTIQQSKTLIYVSNDSVFFHNIRTVNQWELLYNFNALVGQSWCVLLKDTVPINTILIDTITFTVDSVKFVTINSQVLKKICGTSKGKTSQGNPIMGYNNSFAIYDRVGATGYLLPFPSSGIPTECPNAYLICYSDSTLGLYQVDTTSCNYIPSSGISNVTDRNKLLNIYPNPTTGDLYINLSAQNASNMLVHISDVNGRLLINNTYHANAGGTNSYTLDLSTLENGVYAIVITDDAGNILKQDKVILAK